MAIREYETARESGKILHEISLAFYKSHVEISGTNVNDSIVVDHISIICAQIKYFRSSIGVRVAFPWEEVVRLCAAQPAFTRLQLLFLSHDQLVQFMETQRAALDMLNGRISIFYNAKTGTRAADYETLADIGGTHVLLYLERSLLNTCYRCEGACVCPFVLAVGSRPSTLCMISDTSRIVSEYAGTGYLAPKMSFHSYIM